MDIFRPKVIFCQENFRGGTYVGLHSSVWGRGPVFSIFPPVVQVLAVGPVVYCQRSVWSVRSVSVVFSDFIPNLYRSVELSNENFRFIWMHTVFILCVGVC